MINKWLFKHIDNSALILFRIFFGILITLEAWGALFTGWIDRTLMAPQQTFNFIGFDFLQPLPGNGMYYYYFIMGIFGVMVILGYKYRWSLSAFTVNVDLRLPNAKIQLQQSLLFTSAHLSFYAFGAGKCQPIFRCQK